MSIDYCAGQVHGQDYAHYLGVLMMPRRVRPALFALYAFNLELARALAVREVLLGRVRLQWWRDALQAAHETGHIAAQPVLQSLAALMRDGALDCADLTELIQAYENRLIAPEEADRVSAALLDAACKTVGPRLARRLQKIEDILRKADASDPLLAVKMLWQTIFF